jgi:hypothetical protein
MAAPRHITIEGRQFLWRDVLTLRREQRKAARQHDQPALFEMRDDHRPKTQTTASERYCQPLLFEEK